MISIERVSWNFLKIHSTLLFMAMMSIPGKDQIGPAQVQVSISVNDFAFSLFPKSKISPLWPWLSCNHHLFGWLDWRLGEFPNFGWFTQSILTTPIIYMNPLFTTQVPAKRSRSNTLRQRSKKEKKEKKERRKKNEKLFPKSPFK